VTRLSHTVRIDRYRREIKSLRYHDVVDMIIVCSKPGFSTRSVTLVRPFRPRKRWIARTCTYNLFCTLPLWAVCWTREAVSRRRWVRAEDTRLAGCPWSFAIVSGPISTASRCISRKTNRPSRAPCRQIERSLYGRRNENNVNIRVFVFFASNTSAQKFFFF